MTRMVTSYILPRDDSTAVQEFQGGKANIYGWLRLIWMTMDSPTPPSLSLLLFPEPTIVQVLFKDFSVVLLLLLTL